MAHYLVDASGMIVNSIVADETTVASGWQPPEGLTAVYIKEAAGIGWKWDGVKATAPVIVATPPNVIAS